MASSIHYDIHCVLLLHLATSSLSSSSSPSTSFRVRAFSNDEAKEVVKLPEKQLICTADELHYVSVPNYDWRLALWRYRLCPRAMRMYNAAKNTQGRSSIHWKNLAGIPSQPSNKECRYFIMRYMRDIIEDKDMSLFPSKWERRGSSQPKRILIKCEMSGGSLLSTHMCMSHEVARMLLVHFC